MDNHFETNIKDHLNKRQIKPSEDSWSKIENILIKSDNVRFFAFKKYMSIAASFVLIISCFYLLTKSYDITTRLDNKKIVENSQSNNKLVENKYAIAKASGQENVTEINSDKKHVSHKKLENISITRNSSKNIHQLEQESITEIKNILTDNRKLDDVTNSIEESINTSSVLVNRVNGSDLETDQLLKDALQNRKNISDSKPKVAQVKKHKVDPNQLLAEAEVIDHQNFMKKVLKKVDKTSHVIYSIVSSRNVGE